MTEQQPAITAGVILSLISTLLVMLRSLKVLDMTDAQIADVLSFVGIAGPLVMSLWIAYLAYRRSRNPLSKNMTTGPMQQLVPMPPPSAADATSGQKVISTEPAWQHRVPMPPSKNDVKLG